MIVDCIFHVLTTCVVKYVHWHWLVNDAWYYTINMNLKDMEKVAFPLSIENLMEDDLAINVELALFLLT
jgi:hypothetical protein